MEERNELWDQLFYRLTIEDDEMKISLNDFIRIPLDEILDNNVGLPRPKEKEYVTHQLELYFHLSKNRNIRWKNY